MKIYLSKIINLFLAFIMCTTWNLDAVDKKSSPCSDAKSSIKAQFSFDIRSNKKTVFAVGFAAATITSFFALKRQSLTLPTSFLDSIKRFHLTFNPFPVFSHTFLTNLRQVVEQHPKFFTAGSICTALGAKTIYKKYKFTEERRDQERRDQERRDQERRRAFADFLYKEKADALHRVTILEKGEWSVLKIEEREERKKIRLAREAKNKKETATELKRLSQLTYSPPVTKICITDPDFIPKRTDPDPIDPYTQAQNTRSFFTPHLFSGIDQPLRT